MSTNGGGGSHGFDTRAGKKKILDNKMKEAKKKSALATLNRPAARKRSAEVKLINMAESSQGNALRKTAQANKIKNTSDEERRALIKQDQDAKKDPFYDKTRKHRTKKSSLPKGSWVGYQNSSVHLK